MTGYAGTLTLETAQGRIELPVAEIGFAPKTFDFGALGRKIDIYRLPDVNRHTRVVRDHPIRLQGGRDNPLYVSVVTEDGHQAWSSPIYVLR